MFFLKKTKKTATGGGNFFGRTHFFGAKTSRAYDFGRQKKCEIPQNKQVFFDGLLSFFLNIACLFAQSCPVPNVPLSDGVWPIYVGPGPARKD
jgi:hypothetical protein